jgi:hypothetical protein
MKLQLSDGTNLTLDDSLTDDEAMQLWYSAEDQLKSESSGNEVNQDQPVTEPVAQDPTGELTQFNKPVEQPTPEQIAQMQAEANPKDTSDFSRGFKTSYEQLPELGYGLEAGAYAIGETAFGEGGMLTQGKQEAVGKMIEAQKETQANAKESDSFTYAYQKAKEGDFGALADTVQYGLGYGLGQGTQAILAGGIGEVGAKLASEMFAKEYTAKLVEQEALKIAEQNAGRDITQSEIERQAVKNVAESIGKKGRDYTLGAQAVGLEGGEILGDLAKQSTEQNRALTPWEVSRGLGATALAAAGEFYADRFGLDVLGGKRLSEAGKYTEGLKGNLLRGAATGAKGAGIEFGTEFAQTLIEEAGKGKDPFSSDSLRQAIDAAALGGIGGGGIGAIGGALSPAQQKPDQPATGEIDPSMLRGGLDGTTAQTTAQQPAQTSPDWQRTMGDIRSIVGENQLVNNEVIAKDIAGANNVDDALQAFNHIGEAISTDHAITHELKTQEQQAIEAQRGQDQITAMQEPLMQKPVKAKPDKLDATQESLDFIGQAVEQGGAELKGGMLYLPTGEKYSLNKAQRDHYTNLVTPIEQAPEMPTAEMPTAEMPTAEMPTAEMPITEVQTQEQLQKLMNSFQEGDVIVTDTGDRFVIEGVIKRKNGEVVAVIIPPSEEEGSKRFTLDIDGVNALINPQGYYDQKTNERKLSGFGKVERAKPTADYETRNSDRIARINQASTPEEIQSIYAEETSDNERHFEGTRKAEIAVKDKLNNLERESANKKEDEAYAAGEWVFHFPTNSLSDANQMAKSMEKIEPKNEYRVVPWQNDSYLVQKRKIEATPTAEMPVTTYYNEPNGKYYGDVKEVSKIMPQELKPLNQIEINWAISSQKASGKSEEEWAKSVDLSEPIKATIYSDGEIKIQDGHHRYLAAKILNEPLNVELKSINAKNQILNDAINRINKDVSQATVTETPTAEIPVAEMPIETKQQINPEIAGNLKRGEIVVDENGKEYLSVGARHDYLEAFPIENGKADVSKDTLVTFHLRDATKDAFKERNNTPIFTTGKNLYSETPVAETPVAEPKGTINNPILRKNGKAFTSPQGAQTHIRTNPELSKDTHTWVKLGDKKYGIVTEDPVVRKPTKPAVNNLRALTGLEPIETAIGKLGGINREMANRAGFSDFKGWYFTKTSSEGFDGMALQLNGKGYDVDGENDLIAKLRQSLAGKKVYTFQGLDNDIAKMLADREDDLEQQQQDELLNTYTNEEVNAILDAKTQAEKDKIIADIKAEKKRKADLEVDTVVDEMLGKGMTTSGDLFAPERKGKATVGREVTIEGEQLANSPLELKKLYPNHWFYGDKGAQSKFDETEIDYETQYPNLESVSLINTDSNIGGFYDQVEQAIYQTSQSDRTTLHELGHAIHHQLLNYRKLTEDERATLKELILGDAEANHPYLASDKELVAEFNLYAHVFPVKAKAYAPELYKELVDGRKDVSIKLGSQDNKALTAALKQANVTIEKGYGEETDNLKDQNRKTSDYVKEIDDYTKKEYVKQKLASNPKGDVEEITKQAEREHRAAIELRVAEGWGIYGANFEDYLDIWEKRDSLRKKYKEKEAKANYTSKLKESSLENRRNEFLENINDPSADKTYKNRFYKEIDSLVKYLGFEKFKNTGVFTIFKNSKDEYLVFNNPNNFLDYPNMVAFDKKGNTLLEGSLHDFAKALSINVFGKNHNGFSENDLKQIAGKIKEVYGDLSKLNDIVWLYSKYSPKNINEFAYDHPRFGYDRTDIFKYEMSKAIPNLIKPSSLKFSKAKSQQRLAPNGKPSNLNAVQYEQVRTPEFKEWFGDWENDPENASKVVDENGEPLVVYHGTSEKFWEFNEYKGNFFTQDPNYAKVYSSGKKPMALFLNIRNPFDSQNKKDNNFYNTKFIPYFSNKYPRLSEGLSNLRDSEPLSFIWADKLFSALRHFERTEGTKYDGMIVDEGDTPKIAKSNAFFAFVPLHNNQIKSATDNIGAFSKESNDIRFSKARAWDFKPMSDEMRQNLIDMGEEDFVARIDELENKVKTVADKEENHRLRLSHKDVLARIPELEAAAKKLKEGLITPYEYELLSDELLPMTPYEELPPIATEEEARYALENGKGQSPKKAAKYGLPMLTFKDGEIIQLRLDIPSYRDHNTWVVSIHIPKSITGYIKETLGIKNGTIVPASDSSFKAGDSAGYQSVAIAKEVTFGMGETNALDIAGGTPKGTIATMMGKWQGTTIEEAKAKAEEAMNNKEWVQVGMNPLKHSYFYDRENSQPVIYADEIIQIGSLVLAKNPVYGRKSDFRFSETQQPATNTHTEQSLKEGLTKAGDDAYGKGWTDRLLGTGMFKIISDEQAQAIIENAVEVSYSKNGDIEAFYNPANGKTYFVAENIDKEKDLHYLMMHEVSVHMLKMGANEAEFENFLKETDNLVKVKNPAAVKGRQDALDADTPQEDLREETLAYLIKYAPKLKIVQRFKAWLKNALRNMSKMFPASQKLGFIQWANNLSDQDLLYIAEATLRKAPEMLSKQTQYQSESDAILAAKAENRSLIVGNLKRLKDENPDAHKAVMDYLDRLPEDELKRVSDNLEEFKGTPWAMVAVKSMVIRQIYHLSENYESNKDTIDKLTSGTLWRKDDISRYATLKVFLGKDREKKIQLLGKAYDFVGDNRKAENDVAGSFINCDPSKACAEHCYAALANGRPSELLKAEYTEYMASKYPEILANRIYDQYSLTAAFNEKLTLRLNDKGELSPSQLKVIELLNEKGVNLQVFSKRPELLKQVNDRNLKMLSIDTTNFDLALNNPEFKLAITLTDDFTPEMIAQVDDRVSVYLPVNLKGKEWSREKLREMYPEKYKDMSKRICPVDSENVTTKTGTSFVQVLNKEAKGLWTCTTCDKLGTVGCFKGFNTEKTAKYVSASSIGNLSKEKALAKKQDDISSMLSEFKQMEGIDNDTYRKIVELLSKRPSELSESNEQSGDRATENQNIKQNGGNIQEGTGVGETTGATRTSVKFSKKAKEGEIVNRSTGYTAYENAKPIPEEVDNKDNYPDDVSLEEEKDWVTQQLRRFDSFRRLNDKSNELINKYLTTMGKLPELGKYLGMRYKTLGKIDNVDDIVRNVFETLQNATKEDSKEIYTYLTDNKATTDFIMDRQMAQVAKDLKEAIQIIGKKLVEFNIIPIESYQMYEGRYLPRVYLEHIIQSSDRYQSLGSGKTLSSMGYAKKRDNNLPEEVRRLLKGEVKNPAYLASRTISIPLRDIAMMEFFNQISDNEKWVWKQSLINIELDATTNRPTAIFDDDGVINYKATNSALEGAPKKTVVRKVTPYFLDKEADRILDQSYSVPEEDRKAMQDLAQMMKRAASQALQNMDAIPSDFIKMPNVAKYGSLRGLVVHKLIYDDLVGTINTYGATGEQTALENFFGNNGLLARITSAFKFSHVAVNIPTQVTNLLSNGILLHTSGVRFDKVPVRVIQAFKEVLNNGENYQKMVDMGGRKATFSNQELKGITDWLLENEAEFSDKDMDWFSMTHLFRELSYLTGKTVRSANNLHQNIEMIFKVAKFIDMKAKGATDGTAAVMAHRALFDYSFIPRWAKWLRTVPMGIPFITWTIKSFESTLRTLANRPTALLPYYMLGYALSLAAAADFGDDGEDKLKAILKLLPERMQRGGSVWILPIKDDAGRTQLIDMKNLFPWGKTAEGVEALSKLVGNQDVAELRTLADAIGVFSSPITQAVVAIDTNRDAFTGKQIIDENDTSAQKLQTILEYTYGMMMPPMLGSKGDIATIIKSQSPSSYEGIMNKDGSPKKTEEQAFIHLFTGLSLKSVDVEFERHKKIEAFNNMITGIKAQRTRELRANPNLGEEERRIVREKYDARIERVKEKKQKFKDETDVLK